MLGKLHSVGPQNHVCFSGKNRSRDHEQRTKGAVAKSLKFPEISRSFGRLCGGFRERHPPKGVQRLKPRWGVTKPHQKPFFNRENSTVYRYMGAAILDYSWMWVTPRDSESAPSKVRISHLTRCHQLWRAHTCPLGVFTFLVYYDGSHKSGNLDTLIHFIRS